MPKTFIICPPRKNLNPLTKRCSEDEYYTKVVTFSDSDIQQIRTQMCPDYKMSKDAKQYLKTLSITTCEMCFIFDVAGQYTWDKNQGNIIQLESITEAQRYYTT